MPIHDWTRVTAGTWHDFHHGWTGTLKLALNDGLLPDGYYAQAEQVSRPFAADVLTLQEGGPTPTPDPPTERGDRGGTATVVRPRTRIHQSADLREYTRRRRVLSVRHVSGHRIVALIELLSPGNKASVGPFETFVRKAAQALDEGFNLLVIDLFPPTPRDPAGLHAAIWAEVAPDSPPVPFPPDEPLTLAAYVAGPEVDAHVEPTAVGRAMIDMPLYLTAERYVDVPLEATYMAAYRGVPKFYRELLEAPR